MTYIATFYSHFNAVKYTRDLKKHGIMAILMPVPRTLSSSCGTCVKFETAYNPTKFESMDMEQLVLVLPDNQYKVVLSNI